MMNDGCVDNIDDSVEEATVLLLQIKIDKKNSNTPWNDEKKNIAIKPNI